MGLAAMVAPAQGAPEANGNELTYRVVDTSQVLFYDDTRQIPQPKAGEAFFGQDAQHQGHQPSYLDHGDGTVSDLVTGLMWQKDPGEKMTIQQAQQAVMRCRLGNHRDWRLPTIKELYSLIQFNGVDPDPRAKNTRDLKPFIDTSFFEFRYGNARRGERIIDSQFMSSTMYVGRTMKNDPTVFGVNFADGRIKGYGTREPRTGRDKKFYVIFVRGNGHYGKNSFHQLRDGTVVDRATGLQWLQFDSGHYKAGPRGDGTMTWEQALKWAEGFEYAGHDDWRLPNAKELQSIVDYERAPRVTGGPAIDPIFKCSKITVEGKADYPYYWSSTTHVGQQRADAAVYVAFGSSWGWMRIPPHAPPVLLDVHGAGSQRSDPKAGDPSRFPKGRGPQGDVISIHNHVRLVRDW